MINKACVFLLFIFYNTILNASDEKLNSTSDGVNLFAQVSQRFHSGIEEAAHQYPDLLADDCLEAAKFAEQFRPFAMEKCGGDLKKSFTTYHDSLDIFSRVFREHLETLKDHKEEIIRSKASDALDTLSKMYLNKEQDVTYAKLVQAYFTYLYNVSKALQPKDAAIIAPADSCQLFRALSFQFFEKKTRFTDSDRYSHNLYLSEFQPTNTFKKIATIFPTRLLFPVPKGDISIPALLWEFLRGSYPFSGSINTDSLNVFFPQRQLSCLQVANHDLDHAVDQNYAHSIILDLIQLNEQEELSPSLIKREIHQILGYYDVVSHFFKHLIKEVLLHQRNEGKFKALASALFLLFHESGSSKFFKGENASLVSIFNYYAQKQIKLLEEDMKRTSFNFICTCPITGIPFKDNKKLEPEEFIKEYESEIYKYLKIENRIEDNSLKLIQAHYCYVKSAGFEILTSIIVKWSKDESEQKSVNIPALPGQLEDCEDPGLLAWMGVPIPNFDDMANLPLQARYNEAKRILNLMNKTYYDALVDVQAEFKKFVDLHKLDEQYRSIINKYSVNEN